MFIKKTIYKILGFRNYLILISRLFFILYYSGLLRRNKAFDCHYFIKKLIKKGDHLIDIGANLGYYSRIGAKIVGPEGKVISVEPVTAFRKVLSMNTRDFKNITIIPYALGTEDDKTIVMGIPKSNKYLRHGLTKVLDGTEYEGFEFTFNEKMFTPFTLFGNLGQCDYIKCDVEGYEIHIIPQLEFLFKRYLPLIQIEIETENRKRLCEYLSSFSYAAFFLKGNKLYPVGEKPENVEGDFFFVPDQKMNLIEPYRVKKQDGSW